ncbi:poly(A)-specific ribonuclease [Chytridiales sp. JEL 0842]|nr:poly(A)-specific ribonuclease [Chytridiales sp. JEL 0842]
MCVGGNKGDLVVSGSGSRMAVINFYRGIVIQEFDSEYEITRMKRSRYLCCGTNTGKILLRDPRSFKIEHTINAHTGPLSDLDVSGNIVASCGFSTNRIGKLVIEPMIKLYDTRAMRWLPPIPFPSGPCYLKFHPTLSSTIYSVSQSGQLEVYDISNPSTNYKFYQTDLLGYPTAFDISNSGEVTALGCSSGVITEWAEKADYVINPYSRSSQLPDPVEREPFMSVDSDSPFSIVGMPYYSMPLLSVFPADMTFEPGRQAPRVPPEVLAAVKTIDFVGYAKKPANIRRNQVATQSFGVKQTDGPKFRSEQVRESLVHNNRKLTRDKRPERESTNSLIPSDGGVPKHYKNIEIKYSKFGVEDFDFGFYNKTIYGGLETHILNSYCNPLLQVLYFTSPIRDISISHSTGACTKENCLCCELGFLFRMLQSSNGANCQATNFLRAFGSSQEASALGVLEPEAPSTVTVNYANLIQNFNRFILEQLHKESLQGGGDGKNNSDAGAGSQQKISYMQESVGLEVLNVNKCQCQNQESREIHSFVVDMLYKKTPASAKTAAPQKQDTQFCTILQQSLNRVTHARAWCSSCSKYQQTSTERIVKQTKDVVIINLGNFLDEELEGGVEDWKEWIAPRISINVETSGVTVTDIPNGPEDQFFEIDGDEYQLKAIISEIRDKNEPRHLVAHVQVPDESKWYLFNDFLIQPVEEEECFQITKWKVPVILKYERKEQRGLDLPPTLLNYDILLKTVHVNRRKELMMQYKPLGPDELPKSPGFLCAIDSEFVALVKDPHFLMPCMNPQEETELRSDGTRHMLRPSKMALARVSVIRGDGPLESTAFIDDYISISETVVDYLTEFSGIKAGDLDPNSSRHPLVPLKTAYKKLRLLVDAGCIFVGHGLKKDFRTMMPPEQIIDTVDIYFIKERQRKLSLRFLAWSVLRKDIQTESHDSIEDARMALALYKKYKESMEKGTFEQLLEGIYEEGRLYNFRAPTVSGLGVGQK